MNELVTLVAQRTGLSQEDAQKAVEEVINILKTKLPAPIASHLDSLMTGGLGALEAEAGEMLKGKLGGMFGGEKTS
jgi:nucleoid DNA-binding protein